MEFGVLSRDYRRSLETGSRSLHFPRAARWKLQTRNPVSGASRGIVNGGKSSWVRADEWRTAVVAALDRRVIDGSTPANVQVNVAM